MDSLNIDKSNENGKENARITTKQQRDRDRSREKDRDNKQQEESKKKQRISREEDFDVDDLKVFKGTRKYISE